MSADILGESSEDRFLHGVQDYSAGHVREGLDRGLRTFVRPVHGLQVEREEFVRNGLVHDVTTEDDQLVAVNS